MGVNRGGLKTWSALAGNKKRPSEYEIVTYSLLYRNRNPDAAYEQSPDSMMNQWYRKHVRDSLLQHPDWDSFRDPDQVTYRAYTTMQDAHEEYVDGLIKQHAAHGHDAKLPQSWLRKLALLYTPRGLPVHGAADGGRLYRADGAGQHHRQLRGLSGGGRVPLDVARGLPHAPVVRSVRGLRFSQR